MFTLPKKYMTKQEKEDVENAKETDHLTPEHWARVATHNFMLDDINTLLCLYTTNELVEIATRLRETRHEDVNLYDDNTMDKFEEYYKKFEYAFKGWKR